jgi:hypothetical protein
MVLVGNLPWTTRAHVIYCCGPTHCTQAHRSTTSRAHRSYSTEGSAVYSTPMAEDGGPASAPPSEPPSPGNCADESQGDSKICRFSKKKYNRNSEYLRSYMVRRLKRHSDKALHEAWSGLSLESDKREPAWHVRSPPAFFVLHARVVIAHMRADHQFLYMPGLRKSSRNLVSPMRSRANSSSAAT